MYLYNTLLTLSNGLYGVRNSLFEFAVSIRGVYLLGQYLYSWISVLSAWLGVLGGYVADAAHDWLYAYNDLKAGINLPPVLQDLIRYADDILGIARDPEWFIRAGINAFFPTLAQLNNNFVAQVIDAIVSHTGLSNNFLSNPAASIRDIARAMLGDLANAINNPRAYIINKLAQFAPTIREFIADPKAWLRSEFTALAPNLQQLLNDPERYVIERLAAGLERLSNQYGSRFAKIVENIINRMF